jgi:hypothetical protein
MSLKHIMEPQHYANLKENTGGYVALLTVLIIGAVSVSIMTSVVLIGLGTSRSNAEAQRSFEAMGAADACMEAALQLIWNTSTYTGINTLTLGTATCSATVTSTGTETRTITSTGTSGQAVRKVKALLTGVSASVQVSSWQEVADFT